jgi:hypothetical protein
MIERRVTDESPLLSQAWAVTRSLASLSFKSYEPVTVSWVMKSQSLLPSL